MKNIVLKRLARMILAGLTFTSVGNYKDGETRDSNNSVSGSRLKQAVFDYEGVVDTSVQYTRQPIEIETLKVNEFLKQQDIDSWESMTSRQIASAIKNQNKNPICNGIECEYVDDEVHLLDTNAGGESSVFMELKPKNAEDAKKREVEGMLKIHAKVEVARLTFAIFEDNILNLNKTIQVVDGKKLDIKVVSTKNVAENRQTKTNQAQNSDTVGKLAKAVNDTTLDAISSKMDVFFRKCKKPMVKEDIIKEYNDKSIKRGSSEPEKFFFKKEVQDALQLGDKIDSDEYDSVVNYVSSMHTKFQEALRTFQKNVKDAAKTDSEKPLTKQQEDALSVYCDFLRTDSNNFLNSNGSKGTNAMSGGVQAMFYVGATKLKNSKCGFEEAISLLQSA